MSKTASDLGKIIDKVEKLLSLSTSNSEAEAIAAFTKAQELMLHHNLSMKDLEKVKAQKQEQKVEDQILYRAKKLVIWKTVLIYGVATSNHCLSMKVRLGQISGLAVVGRPINIAATKIQFEYLVATVERVSKTIEGDACGGQSLRTYKSSFRLGMAARLQERILEISEKQQQEGVAATETSESVTGIAVRSLHQTLRQEVDEFVSGNIDMEKPKNPRLNISLDGYTAGFESADDVSLSKQIAAEGD
jgi:ElaB/YqjD/DUF883 family membrane-anchored ribosome-binding protein